MMIEQVEMGIEQVEMRIEQVEMGIEQVEMGIEQVGVGERGEMGERGIGNLLCYAWRMVGGYHIYLNAPKSRYVYDQTIYTL